MPKSRNRMKPVRSPSASPGKAPKPATWEAVGKIWDHANTFWAFPGVAAIVMGLLQYLADASAWKIFFYAGASAAVVAITFHLVSPRLRVYASIALGLIAIWSLYQGYQQSRAYQIDFSGFAADINLRPVAPTEPQMVGTIKLGLTFDNPNDFPVYSLSTRRYISLNFTNSGDEQEDSESVMPPKSEDHRIMDLPITFHRPISVTHSIHGTIDYYICFGRDEGKFDKNYRMKGTIIFPYDTNGRLQPPDFYPAEPEKQNHGFYEGCTR